MFTAGGDYSATPKMKPMAAAPDHTHLGGARRDPEARQVAVQGVMQALQWRTPNGCASPPSAQLLPDFRRGRKEALDDPQSRFINERAHANIQKDGTFSVIPRMWGGETTSHELRRIANAVDKYNIPL